MTTLRGITLELGTSDHYIPAGLRRQHSFADDLLFIAFGIRSAQKHDVLARMVFADYCNIPSIRSVEISVPIKPARPGQGS